MNPNQHQQNTRRRPLAEARNNNAPPQPCPRCNSSNTKFCYYNNYSLSQPRYYCKGCRRYWTHGGALRNIPIGGGSRKTKHPKLSSSPTITTQPHPATMIGGSPPISGGFMSALESVSSFGFGPNMGLLYEMGLPDFQNHADLYMQQVFDEAGIGMSSVSVGTLPEPCLILQDQNPNVVEYIDNINNYE